MAAQDIKAGSRTFDPGNAESLPGVQPAPAAAGGGLIAFSPLPRA
jgi:hypothetical protein